MIAEVFIFIDGMRDAAIKPQEVREGPVQAWISRQEWFSLFDIAAAKLLETDIVNPSHGIEMLFEALERLYSQSLENSTPIKAAFRADFGTQLSKARCAFREWKLTGCEGLLDLAWTYFYDIYVQIYKNKDRQDVSFDLGDTSPKAAEKIDWVLSIPGEYRWYDFVGLTYHSLW